MKACIPAGACDSHVHLFGPAAHYPFAPDRVYTPGDADEAALNQLHADLGIDRVVLVQPSVYGTDNTRLLAGLEALGSRARAVAVIDPWNASDAELDRLHATGVRGVRVNIATVGMDDPQNAWRLIDEQARRIAGRDWHVQVLTRLSVIKAMRKEIASLPVPLIVDHFGLLDPAKGPDQPGFSTLLQLLADGHLHVKLSAMRRLTGSDDLAPLAPFIDRLAAHPSRLVWGTDWPHTGGGRTWGTRSDAIEPFVPTDDGAALSFLVERVGTGEELRQILVDTPTRLYGFGENAPR
ncbi:amidohydrolase [uncultured Alsobacter sp.]|uniref:amidohydrolase family protein n=1 Tax=uncultured Alsobacter sp. TaxID=1748258 RepID=UPI0025E7EF6C|nr:amidohydrolase family protein [uncultured Alsobacter sp.]